MTTPDSAEDRLPLTQAILLCRAGFEQEAAEEFQAHVGGKVTFSRGAGLARVENAQSRAAPPANQLIFVRQYFFAASTPVVLRTNDRVTPLSEALGAVLRSPASEVFVEYPDTNDGKSNSTAAKAITPRLTEKLRSMGLLRAAGTRRAHVVLFTDEEQRLAWVGESDINRSSAWPMGIPRLHFPAGAPSRSTLKLAEAFGVFLGEDIETRLVPELRAVDLGAAPGGWTWQFVHRGIRVTAVDNGPLKGDLVDNAMVKHLRMDGFKYVPKVPVDWMVCDMVEQPRRVAQLVATWLENRWARFIIFNLKLPMKRRYEEVMLCRDLIAKSTDGKPLVFRAKQLYHDREEVTCFVCREPGARRRR